MRHLTLMDAAWNAPSQDLTRRARRAMGRAVPGGGDVLWMSMFLFCSLSVYGCSAGRVSTKRPDVIRPPRPTSPP